MSYRIRNWSEYNAGLKQRGSLTFWIDQSALDRRSLAETTMFRFKVIFGGNLSSRKFDNQAVELFVKCAALNRMIQIAKPDSYKVQG